MPLDGLIPIGGALGGSSGSKRGGASDLSSGLISISGARDNVGVDMSDFDVGDLLGDDSGKSKAKSTDKSDDKKKKKSKENKSKSSSRKKSKSKSKKSAFEDDEADEWHASAKNWDSAAELEMAAARRKNGSGKAGAGLDDELAKMLGLDNGDVGTGESPSLNRNDKVDNDESFGLSTYTPTVRGPTKAGAVDAPATDEPAERGGGRLSAAFFQDDEEGHEDLSSLLGPPPERRGGHRGGRRQTATFDALFGHSSSRASPLDDPFAQSARAPLDAEDPRLQRSVEERTTDQLTSTRDDAPAAQRSAKEDLLADLFAPARQERSSLPQSEPVAKVEALSEPVPALPQAVDSSKPPTEYETPKEDAPTPSIVEVEASTPPLAVDLASARDSLLRDLLGDPSPPKPLLSRRRSRSNASSPEKEAVEAAAPFKSSPVLGAETPVARGSPATPPSPGRRRSLTVDKGAVVLDLEQAKDSLLKEPLPSPSASARSSPRRRNSYSQSLDSEEPKHAHVPDEPQAREAPPQPDPPQSAAEKAPACKCMEREAKLTAALALERAELQLKMEASSEQLKQQLAQQRQEHDAVASQLIQELQEHKGATAHLRQQLDARTAANAQATEQLAASEREKRQAEELAAASKDAAASFRCRADLLESELRGLRQELARSKRAVEDAELALARQGAERDEAEQLERHREKRALEALSAQMQRALARLAVSRQVQEEGDESPARVAAEDEARLRVIASLEGSAKRAALHAEQERKKLAEVLRELEAGARDARQGSLEDKERLRQEQQRLDALSAHLQAQAAALREQEGAHAVYMGQQLADARQDARVYEARLAARRTQLERDERALYEARAEFAAFREQTALEIEREHEELRVSRLRLEDAWRELRADRADLEAELASHEDEFQQLESVRSDVQRAEAQLAERTQQVVALAETLDAGTQDLLAREQLVAQQAAAVQETDSSFLNRERALERVKKELATREHRLHGQIRQLDSARGRLTQQRLEQQQLMSAARRHSKVVVDNNKPWRQNIVKNRFRQPPSADNEKAQLWEEGPHIEEDPSGLTPALRKQVEANWQRRNQQVGHRGKGSKLTFDLDDFNAYSSNWAMKSEIPTYSKANTQQDPLSYPHKNPESIKAPVTSLRPPQATRSHRPPPPPTRSSMNSQPILRVNL